MSVQNNKTSLSRTDINVQNVSFEKKKIIIKGITFPECIKYYFLCSKFSATAMAAFSATVIAPGCFSPQRLLAVKMQISQPFRHPQRGPAGALHCSFLLSCQNGVLMSLPDLKFSYGQEAWMDKALLCSVEHLCLNVKIHPSISLWVVFCLFLCCLSLPPLPQ